VPTTRGPERCRPRNEILEEVRHLLDYGFVEIELLGQTVNHWREPADASFDFADLLDSVARLPGLRRLRFVTSYPRDFTPRMIEQIAAHPNICPYLHLPVQSGADRVLKRMGRGYTRAQYLRLVESLRNARRGVSISTDIIVGFPGETDEDFACTLSLLEEVRFAVVFAFKYSPRPGTAAPALGDPVPEATATRRLQELFELQNGIQRQLNQALVGERIEVLVTGWGRESGTLAARSACHRVVTFPAGDAPPAVGTLIDVQVDRAYPHSLSAVLPA
jgi:tRNA-2-methylthio-N6-dimethylallyladenosine synthase